MKKLKINNYSETDYKLFRSQTGVNSKIDIESENKNYNWIPVFEEYMPYIDDIIRNPRRFIQSEELLVQIEKAKKINEESIKHLAQNTHLIQSVDKDYNPQPKKILNIYKEETFDLYENRFIATLINKLYAFITLQYENMKKEDLTEYASEKNVAYKSKTVIDNQEFIASVNLYVKQKNEQIDLKAVKERIDELYEVINQFKKSNLMKQLDRAQPVRSPIRKTNAILKDPQLNKCLELWEILEQLESDIKLDNQSIENYLNEEEFINDLTLSNYINFCTLTKRMISEETENADKAKNIFNDLIKIYIEREDIGILNFRKELVEDLDMLCMQYERDYNAVKETYDNFFASFTDFS